MLSSTVRSRVTWGAMVATLLLGFTLLVVLTGPGSHPKAAQAQTAPRVVLTTVGGLELATISKVDELTSSIMLPRADGKAAQLEPIRVVLERNADENFRLSAWHEQARTQLTGYRMDVYITFYDDLGEPTQKIFLKSAWPAEYHLEQQDGQLVERVTLTANFIQRIAP